MTTPLIPATCEKRPTIGGLVIPWVNVQLADGGVDFRAQHNTRTQRCFREKLCQVCATKLGRPIVFIGGPEQLAKLQFDEPPLHPECAAYVSHACPMIAGRLEHFADRDTLAAGHRGKVCFDPDCDCDGWVTTPNTGTPAEPGRPAHDWYAVYASAYAVGVSKDRPDYVHSAVLTATQVLTIRHVSTPGAGRTWKTITR